MIRSLVSFVNIYSWSKALLSRAYNLDTFVVFGEEESLTTQCSNTSSNKAVEIIVYPQQCMRGVEGTARPDTAVQEQGDREDGRRHYRSLASSIHLNSLINRQEAGWASRPRWASTRSEWVNSLYINSRETNRRLTYSALINRATITLHLVKLVSSCRFAKNMFFSSVWISWSVTVNYACQTHWKSFFSVYANAIFIRIT